MSKVRGTRWGKTLPIVLGAVFCIVAGVVVGVAVSGGKDAGNGSSAGGGGETPVGTMPVTTNGGRGTTAQPEVPQVPVVENPPPIEFDPPAIDMAIMKPGEIKTSSALVRNVSDTPLEIEFTRSSCTCTSINLASTVLRPGESAPLEATYDARQTLGPKRSAVFVGIKGYDQVTLEVLAEVTLAVRAVPAHIAAFESMTGEFILESIDGRPFSVLGFGDIPTQIEDFDPAQDAPRSSYVVSYDLTSFDERTCQNADGLAMPGWLWVETDHPDAPIIDLIVRHECTRAEGLIRRRPWHLSERRILIGAIKPGESREVTVAMSWLRDAPATDTMRAVTTTSQAIDVRLTKVTPSRSEVEGIITVTADAEYRGPFYAEAVIHATGETATLILVGKVME